MLCDVYIKFSDIVCFYHLSMPSFMFSNQPAVPRLSVRGPLPEDITGVKELSSATNQLIETLHDQFECQSEKQNATGFARDIASATENSCGTHTHTHTQRTHPFVTLKILEVGHKIARICSGRRRTCTTLQLQNS